MISHLMNRKVEGWPRAEGWVGGGAQRQPERVVAVRLSHGKERGLCGSGAGGGGTLDPEGKSPRLRAKRELRNKVGRSEFGRERQLHGGIRITEPVCNIRDPGWRRADDAELLKTVRLVGRKAPHGRLGGENVAKHRLGLQRLVVGQFQNLSATQSPGKDSDVVEGPEERIPVRISRISQAKKPEVQARVCRRRQVPHVSARLHPAVDVHGRCGPGEGEGKVAPRSRAERLRPRDSGVEVISVHANIGHSTAPTTVVSEERFEHGVVDI
jgi:hypothetical protein